jgi:peroxiredoxin Q/BCP
MKHLLPVLAALPLLWFIQGCDKVLRTAEAEAPQVAAVGMTAETDNQTEENNMSSPQSASANVKVGDAAPDFTLPLFVAGQPDGSFTLSSVRGEKAVVLYFYPEDDTPGCTKQACMFRDIGADFAAADAVVYGVSADDLESHRQFAEKYSLPFGLLSDPGGEIRSLYGMPDPSMETRARVTYVIDKVGIVREIIGYEEGTTVEEHIERSLARVRELSAE